MKLYTQARKYGAKIVAVGTAAGFSLVPLLAHAELPAAVTTEITATGVMLVAAITAIITAFIAFWGLKKLASKMGWA